MGREPENGGGRDKKIRNWERKKGGRKDLSRRLRRGSCLFWSPAQGLEADREARNGRNGKE